MEEYEEEVATLNAEVEALEGEAQEMEADYHSAEVELLYYEASSLNDQAEIRDLGD